MRVARYETAIVRLRGSAAGGPTAGLGLLVGEDRVVMCAHVVNTALGRGPREQARPGTSDVVLLEFPRLPGTPVRKARITIWLPPPLGGTGGGDIAGLTLTEQAPEGSVPARFAVTATEPGAWLRVFGYPGRPARSTGAWVDVELKGEAEGGPYQVESRAGQTVKAQPGYSGSPAWDDRTGEAVGLLQTAPFADDPERDAYLLPPLAFAGACEEQFDYLLVPENPYRGLEPFTAEHADVFFGRAAEIAELTDRVDKQPVVVVVGPSGVGKSSLVQAGTRVATVGADGSARVFDAATGAEVCRVDHAVAFSPAGHRQRRRARRLGVGARARRGDRRRAVPPESRGPGERGGVQPGWHLGRHRRPRPPLSRVRTGVRCGDRRRVVPPGSRRPGARRAVQP
jgi:hypothetical protein